MPFVLDESAYRVGRNTFPSREEAIDVAQNSATTLGRPITCYELLGGELHFAFRVMPDGSLDETNPLVEHQAEPVSAPAVLGSAGGSLTRVVDRLKQQFTRPGET